MKIVICDDDIKNCHVIHNYLLKPVSYETICRELKKVFVTIQEKKLSQISLNCKDGLQ